MQLGRLLQATMKLFAGSGCKTRTRRRRRRRRWDGGAAVEPGSDILDEKKNATRAVYGIQYEQRGARCKLL